MKLFSTPKPPADGELMKSFYDTLNRIDRSKPISVDIETTGTFRHTCDITTIQLGYFVKDSKEVFRNSFIWGDYNKHQQKAMVRALQHFKIITHNGKFDVLFLWQKTGLTLPIFHDTLVMAHVCGEERLSLKWLVFKYFGIQYNIDLSKKTGEVSDDLIEYGEQDAEYTLKLARVLLQQMKKKEVVNVYRHEMRAFRAYVEVEKNGCPVSPRRHDVKKKLQEEYKPYHERLLQVANINWKSNKQVSAVLFSPKSTVIMSEPEKIRYTTVTRKDTGKQLKKQFKTKKEATEYLVGKYGRPFLKEVILENHREVKQYAVGSGQGLEVLEYTKKGEPSVGIGVLSQYRGIPLIDDLLEYKRLTKLEQFIDSWEELMVDSRVYPSFNLTARTGRTTSKYPNIQQVPQSSYIRNLIEAKEGWKIAECFSGDTEVLTTHGWVRLDEYTDRTPVAQYDVDTQEITFDYPLGYIHKENVETFRYEDRGTSLCLTGNHNVLTTYKGNPVFKLPFKDVKFSGGNSFINAGYYDNGVKDFELESRFIAMFNADGSQNSDGYVSFCFSKLRKVERCRSLLEDMGIKFTERVYTRSNGVKNYTLYIGNRCNSLISRFTGRNKNLKWNCLTELNLDAYIDECSYWDCNQNKTAIRLVTTKGQVADVHQAICHLRGIRCHKTRTKGRKPHHSDIYYLNYNLNNPKTRTYMKDYTLSGGEVQDVYCLNMPLGTLVIRHNNKVSIQGNCDFSQLELRVASWVSGDENMQEAYRSGSDLHNRTKELMFAGNILEDHDGAKRQRTQAKSCFSGDTEILTEKGFVPFREYDGVSKVAQYSTDSKEISYTDVLDFRMIPRQSICSFENENTSLRLTPNHECLVERRANGKVTIIKTPYENIANLSKSKTYWINAGYYKYDKSKFISDNLTRFIACFVADGSYSSSMSYIRFGFTKKRKIERFRGLMDNLGVKYTSIISSSGSVSHFTVTDFRLVTLLKGYCSKDKTLTERCLTELNPLVYLDEAQHWDGSVNKSGTVRISSTNKDTLDIMQIMAVQSGIRARLLKQYDTDGVKSTTYMLSYNFSKSYYSRFEVSDIDSRTHQKGTHNVYCVTVPEHNIVIRHNGKVSIQGNCNFGYIYGMSPKKFVEYATNYGLNLTLEESTEVRRKFFSAYPRLSEWHEKAVRFARLYGYSVSPLGRKRFLPNIYSNDFKEKSGAERQSINSPVQGMGSDLCISALADIIEDKSIDKSKCKVIGSVHDAILFEIRDEYVDEVIPKIKYHMENPSVLEGLNAPVPFSVDCEVAQSWGG